METIAVIVPHCAVFVVCKLVGYTLARIMGDDGEFTRVIVPRSSVALLNQLHLLADNQNRMV